MKVLPVKLLRKLIDEVSETMMEHPGARHYFVVRGRYTAEHEGSVELALDLSTPAIADSVRGEIGTGIRRKWDDVGVGEFVYRMEREPSE